MRRKKTISLVLLCIMVLVGAYAYKEYTRKPANLKKARATVSVEAATIVSDYLKNEAAANGKYLGKIIEVKGLVVTTGEQNLIIGDASAINNVSCTFDSIQSANAVLPQVGASVTVKGVCTGFLVDVELNRCVMVIN